MFMYSRAVSIQERGFELLAHPRLDRTPKESIGTTMLSIIGSEIKREVKRNASNIVAERNVTARPTQLELAKLVVPSAAFINIDHWAN